MKTITLRQFAASKGVTYQVCYNHYKAGKLTGLKKFGREFIIEIDESFPGYETLEAFRTDTTQTRGRPVINLKMPDLNPIRICQICGAEYRERNETCSIKCRSEKIKKTNIKKFGTICPCNSNEIAEKIRLESLERHGVMFPAASPLSIEKRKKTCLERFGTEFAISSSQARKKSKETILERYGTENVMRVQSVMEKYNETCLAKYGSKTYIGSQDFVDKSKVTLLERYGVDNALKSEIVILKVRKTMLEKYGVEYPSQSSEIREKTANTNIKRYGSLCTLNNADIRKKAEATCIANFGVSNAFQSEIVRSKITKTMLERYGVENSFQIDSVRIKQLSYESRAKRRATIKRNKNSNQSRPENEVFNILCSMFGEVERQVPVHPWEIDFYIPSIKTFINFNGTYWHGRFKTIDQLKVSTIKQDKKIMETKNRDRLRYEYFTSQKLNFIIIWEDDFKNYGAAAITDALSAIDISNKL